MALTEYKRKRDFKKTSEPAGKPVPKKIKGASRFVIQKHAARRLHYDFRLEMEGVLKSWALPKGLPWKRGQKHLAVEVEDHPIDYEDFEGVIPEGEYGGGTVMLWDTGTWTPATEDPESALKKGDLKFTLHGKKLRGSWVLVRTKGYGSRADKSWLLIKHRDKFASTKDITATEPRSVVSHKLLADIAGEGGGDIAKAATGDPQTPKAKRVVPSRKKSQETKSK